MINQWKVEHDGPSRPVIIGPKLQMFSISKYERGKWQSFTDEEEVCQILCNALNNAHKDGLIVEVTKQKGESQMPIEDRLLNAFKRISHLSTETVGDMCKDDLIKLGNGLGLTEEELKRDFPNLYERSADVEVASIGVDEEAEQYDLDSLGNSSEDTKIDEQD